MWYIGAMIRHNENDRLTMNPWTPRPSAGPYVTPQFNSDFDIRHSFTAGVTYDLPTPKWNNLARGMLGGWSVDTFVLARSAPPVNIISAIHFAAGTALYPRPNLVPGEPLELFGSQYPGGKIFNKAAFIAPPPGTQGNFGRNVLRGFGATQFDVALQRQFHLTEKVALRFRSEFFNILNHPNFGNPVNTLTSPLFGAFDADARQQPRRPGWSGVQSAIPDWRAALDSARPQAPILVASHSWLCRVLKTCMVTGTHVGVPGPPNLFNSRKLHGINESSPRTPGLSPLNRNAALHPA